MLPLAHLTSEPHFGLLAAAVLALAAFGLGLCAGLLIARRGGRPSRS